MRESVIVGGARTPFGKFGGGLKDVPAVELGGTVIREAIQRSSLDPTVIEAIIMGMVLQGEQGRILRVRQRVWRAWTGPLQQKRSIKYAHRVCEVWHSLIK